MKYFERGLPRSFKIANFIFLLNPISFDEQDHEKQKGSETSDHSLISLQTKFRKYP